MEEPRLSAHELRRPIRTAEEKSRVLPSYFKSYGIVHQHINSYNHFINVSMPSILQANNIVTCEEDPRFRLQYTNIYLGKPSQFEEMVRSTITPHEARLRDSSYTAPIYVDVVYTKSGKMHTKHRIHIGDLPVMLRSQACVLTGKRPAELARLGECPIDPGGYFITRGQERVIFMQENLRMNRIIVQKDKKGDWTASVSSSTHHSYKTRCSVVLRGRVIRLAHNSLASEVSVVTILKALGIESAQEAVSLVGSGAVYGDAMSGSLEEVAEASIHSTFQAKVFLARRLRGGLGVPKKTRLELVDDFLKQLFLSHIPVPEGNFKPKIVFLCTMIRRVILAARGDLVEDDKDYYGNKRLELAGDMLSLLFEDLLKRFNSAMSRQAKRNLSRMSRVSSFDITDHVRTDIITNGMITSIATGTWNIARFRLHKVGVTDVVSRLSYISALGMTTRLISSVEKTRKLVGPRGLHGSHWGSVCPSDTPEGHSIGLVKNLALLCHVSTDEDAVPIMRLLLDMGVEDVNLLSGDEITSNWLVFINGQILGVHRHPVLLVRSFRDLRRSGRIGEYVSIYMNEQHRAVYVSSDGGRCCRPLIICADGQPRLQIKHVRDIESGYRSFSDLLQEGVMEFLDVNEQNDSYIAMGPEGITSETTHMEIDPLSILGVCASIIPYPHHNQSPRNTYQCAMGKQAIGAIGYNQLTRSDKMVFLNTYPQKPLVKTRPIDFIGFDKLPAGQNATVAVMSYSGYDIEDAIVLNQASLDRGFQRCLALKKWDQSFQRYRNQSADRIVGPPVDLIDPNTGDIRSCFEQYAKVDNDGLVSPGTELVSGDIMVNRQVPNDTRNIQSPDDADPQPTVYRPAPAAFRLPKPARVDRVLLTSNERTNFLVKVITRQLRVPELGDKFSSRHGQKGTVGLVAKRSDLPFNREGICPDLIMNPHGFPSRMTVGKMLELIAGKAGVLHGHRGDGTVFAGDKVETIGAELVARGFNYHGKDVLYSGITGEPLSAYIFFGPIFYQRLKHMVQDKMHARAHGPKALLTRQPTEGRARDGGLRLGEMERDCLVSYGAASLVLERLMVSSDQFVAHVCDRCGMLGMRDWCQTCRTGRDIVTLKLPYACKLMFQELQAMGVVPRLILRDSGV